MNWLRERLAQALHAVGLFELEARARAGSFDGEQGKLTLVRELDLKAKGMWDKPFAVQLIDKLRTRLIHGDFHKAE